MKEGETMTPGSEAGYIMKAGQFADKPIALVPTGYLNWMVSSGHAESAAAAEEIERRKPSIATIEVSQQAVDRASTSCLQVWQRTRGGREGIYTWLTRMAQGALAKGVEKEGKIAYGGVLFVFDRDGPWPILKTVSAERLIGMN